MNSKTPISERKPSLVLGSRGCLTAFGAIFLIAGLIASWFTLVRPMWQLSQATSWNDTEATITFSEVKIDRDSEGTTYRPEIRFKYVVNGESFESSNRVFFSWSSSNQSWARKTVERYPVGSKHMCYYDPSQPSFAVLDRDFNWTYCLGSFTLIFVIIGGVIIWIASRQTDRSPSSSTPLGYPPTAAQSSQPSLLPAALASANLNLPWSGQEGPRRLKPELSRWRQFITGFVVAVFWNSISWFMLVIVIRENGIISIGTLFLSVFVLIGAGLVLIVLHQFLALFNPDISIAISNAVVEPGSSVDVAWETIGNTRRIRELTIDLIGNEIANYTRGTKHYTDHAEFFRLNIVRTTDPGAMEFGSETIDLPLNAIHSFSGQRNKIEWSFQIHGDIRMWPDVTAKYPFFVKPRSLNGETA